MSLAFALPEQALGGLVSERRMITSREVQSQFYNPKQVSILVCIIYRLKDTGNGPELVKDFVFGITDDLYHHARVSALPCAPRRKVYLANLASVP